jgi:hypothetical protein
MGIWSTRQLQVNTPQLTHMLSSCNSASVRFLPIKREYWGGQREEVESVKNDKEDWIVIISLPYPNLVTILILVRL